MELLSQNEKKVQLTQVLEKLSKFITDFDDPKIKEKVRSFLKSATDACVFVAIGEESAGKTSFLNSIFDNALTIGESIGPTRVIEEIRYGARDATINVNEMHIRKFMNKEELNGIVIVDTPSLNSVTDTALEKLKLLALSSDAIFVVLPADNVESMSAWDFLQDVPNKKVVFILTKSDLFGDEKIEESKKKIQQYAREAEIDAQIFAISTKSYYDNGVMDRALLKVRQDIKDSVIGDSPYLAKQESNILALRGILSEIDQSFKNRQLQYEEDMRILTNINRSIDNFRAAHEINTTKLSHELSSYIDEAIDDYREDIIRWLNPRKIKENFTDMNDFHQKLRIREDIHKRKMNASIDRKTQNAIRGYIGALKQVFDEISTYLINRGNLLDKLDPYYGEISRREALVVGNTCAMIVQTSEYYKELSQASEELFRSILEARRTRDTMVNLATAGGVVAGGLGIGFGAALFGIPALWPLAAGAIGAAAIGAVARNISLGAATEKMEQDVRQCIAEFDAEVLQIRDNIKLQLTGSVTEMFENELRAFDKGFLDYRKIIYQEEKQIPGERLLLEEIKSGIGEIG